MPIFVPPSHYDPRSHYDPNQPRVPSGEPGAGQWTDAGRNGAEEIQKTQGVTTFFKLLRELGKARVPVRPPIVPLVPPRPQLPIRPGISGGPPRLPDMPPRGLGIPPIMPGIPLLAPKSFDEDSDSVGPTNQEVLDTAFRNLAVLSERHNSRERRVFVGIQVQRPPDEKNPADADARNLAAYGLTVSSPTAVNKFCKGGLDTVQQMVNAAVSKVEERIADDVKRGGVRPSAQAYGIAVHRVLENMIKNKIGTPLEVDMSKFSAEISYGQDVSPEARRGEKGTIRIDVVQDLGNGTVCMYDLKTGLKPLSAPRMEDFANRVLRADKVKHVFVTEVRPEI